MVKSVHYEALLKSCMTHEISGTDPALHWSIALEQVITAHFEADIALDAEYDERFAASDLLGASSVLHLQAMQEAALGNSTPARLLAETAIYFAGLCRSLDKETYVRLPKLAAAFAERTARVDKYDHKMIQNAAESGIEAAHDKLDRTRGIALERAREGPILPHRLFALTRTYCYALQIYADIAQDRFHGTDPTIYQRNRALWYSADIVDELLVAREKKDVVAGVFISKETKLHLAIYAFELINAYAPPEADRGIVLEAQDACYQGLAMTVSDAVKQDSIDQRAGRDLSWRISTALGKVTKEQQELGVKSNVRYSEILDSWPDS